MKHLYISALIVIGVSSAHAVVFENNSSTVIPRTTSNGHSTNWGIANTFITIDQPGMEIVSLNSVTVRGLRHNRLGSMFIWIGNGAAAQYLYYSGFEQAGVNGTIAFTSNPAHQTLNQRASLGGTIGNGSFRVSAPNGDGAPSPSSLSAFGGTPLSPGFQLTFENYDRDFAGSITGWSVDVTLRAVPEPASMVGLGMGLAWLLRKRKK